MPDKIVSTTVVDTLHISNPLYYKTILYDSIKISDSWFLFIFFDWSRLEGAGRIFCYLVWIIVFTLDGVCNGIGYV